MSFEFGGSYDPFKEQKDATVGSGDVVHIRIQQRNGRKTLTTVQGLDEEIDKKRVLKLFKRVLNTNGTVTSHKEHGEVIQVQGDHRDKVAEIIVANGIASKERIRIHGF